MSGLYISDDEQQELLIKNKSIQIVSYQNELLHELQDNSSDNNNHQNNNLDNNNTVDDIEVLSSEVKINNKHEKHRNNIKKTGHYESPKYRWFVLIILGMQSISIWYCFDTLSILHNEFYDEFKLTNFEYNLLYSFAVFPSLILAIFASYIIDKYGITYSLLISLLFSFCGESLFAISCTRLSYTIMLIARSLYGIGCSFNSICSFIIIYHYFNNREFATSLSISFSCIRLGFIINDFITIYIVNTFDSIALSIWFGVMLIFLSFICTLYMLGKNISWLYMNSIHNNNSNNSNNNNQATEEEIAEINNIHTIQLDPSHLYSFKIGFWLLSLICGLGFAFFSTWNSIGVELMHSRYGLDESTADYYLLILYIIPCILSPLNGLLLDRNKHFYSTLLVGGILGIFGHIVMMIRVNIKNEYFLWINHVSSSPTLSLILIAFGYTLFNSALWPSIPYMIDAKKLGSGYGLIYAMYCVCYSISQLIIPMFIKHESNNNVSKYDYVCVYLIGLSIIYCILSIILWLWKKDDDYRVSQYKSISSISPSLHLSIPLTINEDDHEDVDDEEGEIDEYLTGNSTIMGAIESNVSTMSLFSDDHSRENAYELHSETMLGYAGENEIISLNLQNVSGNKHNCNADDNSSTLNVARLTDDEKSGLL